MKRFILSITLVLVCAGLLPENVLAAELLIPGGSIVGLELRDDTVTVAAFDDVLGANAQSAGLQIGDEIVSIDKIPIDSANDVRQALTRCGGSVTVTVRRGEKTKTLRLSPQSTDQGPRLGVYLRQGIAGVGTITYYDPESGEFGALGHGVSSSRGGLLSMTEGNAYTARVLSVKPGKCGQPGQLRGSAEAQEPVGTLFRNTPQGIFGKSKTGWRGEPLPVADYEDVRLGSATIRSTVCDQGVQEYSVEILKIYPEDRPDSRNFLLKVTDPALLETTGGIVQGMSGSPIIQDGKLIGAVTHVLVNDPTTGYGIFIENMLDAAA